MVKNYLFILFLGALSLLARDVFAVTAVPWPVEKAQPDGTAISVYLRGDEQVHWMESLDGYTLMYDDQKYVVYAKQDARGNLVPSNIRYGSKAVQSPSPKGLRYSKDQVEALKQIWEITSGSGGLRSQGQQKAGATTGERKALCVLMSFTDKAFGTAKGEYENLFNQLGLYPDNESVKGSVRDFFRENSYGQLDFTVTVVGPYLAENTAQYYANQNNYREFATLAAEAADADVDYNDFTDTGVLETFHILFAGYGDEAIGNGQQIWSHKWQLATPITLDGVKISVYSCSPELRGSSGTNITYIGVVCHELSHVFGSPDYYDTGYAGFPGTGDWDLMAGGSWNDGGRQPAHINMFQKMLYGWVTPEALTTQKTVTEMPASALNPVAYTIEANDNGELYILDNRQPAGFDASLPGHGLLIWHVHPAALGGSGSNSGHPQQLYPVVASSTVAIPNSSPASYGIVDGPGAPYPGTSGNTSFSGTSTPTMFTWTGLQPVAKPVTEITEAEDGTISFKFLDGPTDPVTDLIATVTGNNVKLDWTPPARDDIQGYKIFRDGALQFSTSNKNTTTYTQVGVLKGNYEYCVSAVYGVTESEGACAPVAVTTGSDEFYLPVSDLQATAGISDVNLSWTAPFTGGWTGIAGNPNGAYYFGFEWDFFAGTLWNPSDLKGLNGYTMNKVKFVPIEDLADGATYAVAIYEVPATGDPVLLQTQNVTGTLDYEIYNEITLDSPITIDATKGIIVGIQVHTVGGNCLPYSQGDMHSERNVFYDEDGWVTLEDVGVSPGRNYCLQVYLDGDAGSAVLPEPNIPANTSFLKKGSSKKLKAGETFANDGFSPAPSTVAAYHIYRDGVKIGSSTTASYADDGLAFATAYAYCVIVEYADGVSSEGVCLEVTTENPYKPVTYLKALAGVNEVKLSWEPQSAYTTLFEEDFENGIPASWSNIDQDGDGNAWKVGHATSTPQSGSKLVTSDSYLNGSALTPDNWLITPAITLTANNKLRYYVCAAQEFWPAEHYGVFISTSITDLSSFTKLWEEGMTAAPGNPGNNPAPKVSRPDEPLYAQGKWYERTIDLSEYNGQTVYIAFRHFNCTNQWSLNLDNVTILSPFNAGAITYNVYEGETKLANGLTSPQHTQTGVEIGTHTYCVTAVYDGVNESEPACVDVNVESPYRPVTNLKAKVVSNEIDLTWEPQAAYTVVFEEDFENGIPAAWGNVDADGDSYSWEIISAPKTTPQSGNNVATSASYLNDGYKALTPDNWLITPAVALTANNQLRYYVSAQDAAYPAEHYGVYISTSDAVPGTFELLLEETMTAAPGKPVSNPVPGAFRSSGPQYVPGAWYERTIDLSAYNGQTVYIAFRHFDCSDKFYLNIDNIKILEPIDVGAMTFAVYDGNAKLADGLTSPQYAITGAEPGIHNYCVTAVYDGINESETTCVEANVIPLGNLHRPVHGLKAAITEPFKGELAWNAPVFVQKLRHHTYDSGIYGGIAINGANIDLDVAARWVPEKLEGVSKLMLTKVRFVPLAEKSTITYSVRVWIGGGNPSEGVYDAGQLVTDQLIPEHTAGEWNEVVLETPVPIDHTQEIWIGLRLELPAGGNAVSQQNENTLDGIGNLILWNGTWSPITDIAPSLTGNWIIDGIAAYHQGLDPTEPLPVLPDDGNRASGESLSASEGGTAEAFIEQLPALPTVTKYLITRNGEELGETTETTFADEVTEAATHTYCVQVVYDNEGVSGHACTDLAYEQTPVAITAASIETKTYDGTVNAAVASVTLSDGTSDLPLTLGEDFSATAEFSNPNAGTGKTVVVTVTMLHGAYALDEITFGLSNQVILKAIPDYSVPTLSALIGQTLEDLALPQGWKWDVPLATPVGNVGEHQFPATFTPGDLANYEIVSAILVPVIVTATQAYEVTIAASDNGSIASDKLFAEENDLVTLTALPDEGYEVGEVKVTKAGDDGTSIETAASELTYTFTMPGYAVTVQATFTKGDSLVVAEIKELLEKDAYTVNQAVANTSAQISNWLTQTISNRIASYGVSIPAAGLTLDAFTAAVAGTAAAPAGISGSFAFKVSLARNEATATTLSLSGTITPIPYTPPVAEVFYSLSIPAVEGFITNWRAGSHSVSEHTYVTLMFQAIEGHSIEWLRVYVNGTERTLTLRDGIYELALGYLVEHTTITVDGATVGAMPSPAGNGALRAVRTDDGLHVYGLTPGIALRVYNVSGLLIYQGKAVDTEQLIPIRERGFYIIVSDGSSVKAAL